MVLFGVIGELVVEFKKFPYNPTVFPPLESLKKRIEITSLVVLILGLLLEIGALPHSMVEAGDAQKIAGEANERASTNELAAKQLEIQLNETKMQQANDEEWLKFFEPFDLGNDDDSFAMTLRILPSISVQMRFVSGESEQITDDRLAAIFENAYWTIINNHTVQDFGEQGIVIGTGNDATSKRAALLLLGCLQNNKVPSVVIDRITNLPPNSVIVVICEPPFPASKPPNSLITNIDSQIAALNSEISNLPALSKKLSKTGQHVLPPKYVDQLSANLLGEREALRDRKRAKSISLDTQKQNLRGILSEMSDFSTPSKQK